MRALCYSATEKEGPSMADAVHLGSGKVRELYALGDERLLIVATDRISAFDVVLPTAHPGQGPGADRDVRLLVRAHRATSCANHLLDRRAGPRRRDPRRECRRLEMLPIECVVRGYLSGSGWKEYQRDRRRSAAIGCPPGLRESDRLPEPIFTPATKAETRPRREHLVRRRRPQIVGDASAARRLRAALDRALPVAARPTRASAASSSPTPSSSSASTATASSCWATRC